MGLFKRLVAAVEKIANRPDNTEELDKLLRGIVQEQGRMQIQLSDHVRKRAMKERWGFLKSKQEQGKKLSLVEKHEIEIGDQMFGKS